MPVGHPLFLFSVGERTTYASDLHGRYGLCAVRQRAGSKWSWILTDWDETWVDWSWPICARTTMAVFGYATRGPSLFSDQNEKMGFLRARIHLESSNLVCRHTLTKGCFASLNPPPLTRKFLVTPPPLIPHFWKNKANFGRLVNKPNG